MGGKPEDLQTASLVSSILGLGGSVVGAATGKKGLGDPFSRFSGTMSDAAVQQQNQQVQVQRLLQQQQQQEFYRQQSEAAGQRAAEHLGITKENLELSKQAAKRADNAEKRQERQLQSAEKQDNMTKLNTQAAVSKLKKAGVYLSQQQQLILNSFLDVGNIKAASDFIQKSDQYARIRALQDQGKLDPNNFDGQVRGLYPELTKEQMKNFLPAARKTFVEDPGWFKAKKLIPQMPTGWSMKKKTP